MTPAESLARRLHADQVDKTGQPYVGHLERVVANLLRRWPDATEDDVAAAWLHDALEDTGEHVLCIHHPTGDRWFISNHEVSRVTAEIVAEVSRPLVFTTRTPMPYRQWISILANAGTRSAIRIKLADLEDNMEPARVAAIPDGERLVRTRYAPARAVLDRALRERFDG